MKISGKLVLITGASSGIGEATAKAIARKNGRVLLLARDKTRLERVASEITGLGGHVDIIPIDLSDAEALSRTAAAIVTEKGIPDILINNAGAGRWLTVPETNAAEVEQMMAAPYFAAFNLTRAFLPFMLKRGSGHIVNVTSVASRLVWPGAAAYTAARWAVNGFNNALRTELRGSGVSVTLAVFGGVNSPYWTHNPGSKERLPKINSLIPILTAEQTANFIVRGIERNAREVIRPGMFRAVFLLNALFPRTTEMFMHAGWRGNI
jgi:short-subunit dehydrogenase